MYKTLKLLTVLALMVLIVSNPILSNIAGIAKAQGKGRIIEVLNAPVVLEAFRYRRIILPSFEEGVTPRSPIEELHMWIYNTYLPVGDRLYIPNSTKLIIPKGESYILALAPTLLLETAAGATKFSELLSIEKLLNSEIQYWEEYVPYKEYGFLWYRRERHEAAGPPNILTIYYTHYYRDRVSTTSGSKSIVNPSIPGIEENYRKLYRNLLEIAGEVGIDPSIIAEYSKLVIEWEVDNPDVGVLYPIKMSHVLPSEMLIDGLEDKYLYSPTYSFWDYSTEFPAPLPLYPTTHYLSFIDLNDPISYLENNIVIVGINPSAYQGSFNLRIRIKTLTGRILTTLNYRFEVGEEYWKFLETNQPIIWSYAPLQLREQVEALAEKLGLNLPGYYDRPQYAALYTKNAYTSWGIAEFPSYDVNWISDPLSVTLSKESYGEYEYHYTHNMYVQGSVKIVGYGVYGEVYLKVTYYYSSSLYREYKLNNVVIEEERTSSKITAVARLVGGGALPIPSPLIVAYMTREGEVERSRPKGFKKVFSGTDFIGYAIYSAETSGHEFIAGAFEVGCLDVCRPSHLVNAHYTRDYTMKSQIEGFTIYRVEGIPLYLFPILYNSGLDYSFRTVLDYNGTGKPNYILASTLDLSPTLTSSDSRTSGFKTFQEPKRKGVDYKYTECKGEHCYYDEEENKTVCEPICKECEVSCSYLEIESEFTNNFRYILLGSDHPHIPENNIFVFHRFLSFIPSQNIEFKAITPDTTYINAEPILAETLPGGRIRYVVEAMKDGEPLSGKTLRVSLMYGLRTIREFNVGFSEDGVASFDLEAPSLDELADIMGGWDTLNAMLCNSTGTPIITFTVNFTVPGESLSTYTALNVKVGMGITGTVAAIDFEAGNKVGSTMWLGFRVTDTEYHPALLDPNLEEVPLEMMPFVSNYIESIEDNLGRELGLEAETYIIAVNATNPSQSMKLKVNGTSYAITLQPGNYIVYLEVKVNGWEDKPLVFKTKEISVTVADESVVLDYYMPIAPVFRALKLIKDVREWSITNLDLAYLVEGLEKVAALPAEKLSIITRLLSRTIDILAGIGEPICNYGFDTMTGFTYHLFEVPPPEPCSYVYQVARILSGLLDYLASGERDPAIYRKYALEMAKVNVSLGVADIIEKDIEELFLGKTLPSYDTEKFLLNPADPWNRLYREILALAFIYNLKTHITRQVRILAKLTALLMSLSVKDYLVANKLFPLGNTMSKLVGKTGELLGGQKSVIVRSVSRVFPSLQIILNSAKIGAFTMVGMGLNLGITNSKVKNWIVPAGYKGVDVGYSIANFFKFNRFALSVLINSAETDCIFEVVFQAVSQLSTWTLFTIARYPIDLVFLYYHKQVWSGKARGTIFDAMKAAYVSEASVLGTAKILELLTSSISFLANFLRGFGGLMDYVSSVKSVAAFKKLFGKTADNDVFLEYIQAKKFGEAASLIKKRGILGFMARVGKPMTRIGVRAVVVALSIGVAGLLATNLASAHFAYNLLFPTNTSLAGMVSDIGSIVKLFGKYRTIKADNPLDKSTYGYEEGLIEEIKNLGVHAGDMGLKVPLIQDIEWRNLGSECVFKAYSFKDSWSSVGALKDSIKNMVAELRRGVLDLDLLATIGMLGEDLWWLLEEKRVEALSIGNEESLHTLSIISDYEYLFNEFLREAYRTGAIPEWSSENVAATAEMLLKVISEIEDMNLPNPANIKIPYATIRAEEVEPGLLRIIVRAWNVDEPLKVIVGSTQYKIIPPEVEVNEEVTAVNVTYEPLHPNLTVGIIDINVIIEQAVIGHLSLLIGSSDLHKPWTYDTSLGKLYSLKELEFREEGDRVKILNGGTNLFIVYGDSIVKAEAEEGIVTSRIIKTSNVYISVIRLVNTTTIELTKNRTITRTQQTIQPTKTVTPTTGTMAPGIQPPPIPPREIAIIASTVATVIVIAILAKKFLIPLLLKT